MITRTCQQCSKEYETYPSVRKKYCSQECYALSCRKGQMITCLHCGQNFYRRASKPEQKYCSISCGISARNLTDQNPSYRRDLSGSNNPMYGKGFSGADNPMFGKTGSDAPRWNGGRRVRPDGYITVVAPRDHPNPSEVKTSGTKYILEHRFVMEQHLGRYLLPEEVVHHIDGDPSNNNIDNLELYANQSDHISQGHSS